MTGVPVSTLLARFFETGLVSAEDIRPLRALILTLAMRGRLVPQSPEDEPADGLLAEIEAERQRRVSAGRLKRGRPLPAIRDDEQPYALPAGWVWVRLGTFLHMVNGRAFKPSEWTESGLPIVRIQNLNNAAAPFNYCREASVRAQHLIDDDELLISWSGTPGTSFGVFIWKRGKAALNQHIFKCEQIGQPCVPAFLQSAVNSRLDFMISQAQGAVGLQHITKASLEHMLLPLPPRAEQQRIVARIDELMTLCDALERLCAARRRVGQAVHQAAVGRWLTHTGDDACRSDQAWAFILRHFGELYAGREGIEALRQVIQRLGVMGRLVPQDPREPPAAELLREAGQARLRLAGGTGRRRLHAASVAVLPAQGPRTLPHGWAWARFGAVTDTRLGKMMDKSKNRGRPRPSLRNTNVQWHRFDLRDVQYMKFEDDELEVFRVYPGDLLICEGGEPGRCAVWQDETTPIYFQKALHRARALPGISSHYLGFCLASSAYSGELARYFTGATIKHLSGEKLAGYVLPLPSSQEQHRIVARVGQLLALCDRVERCIVEADARRAALLDAIRARVAA